ncbi:MAG: isochorismatase family cysteine hydrolase [Clostridia bacterium]|nr:isochorismatase family cysteine hydrolase [Clostridia bacterium]
MKKYLVVVDMQKDFVDGALGSAEAAAVVPGVVEKIRAFDGKIYVTYDTHHPDYMNTAEGKKLPVPHCIRGTAGWELDMNVAAALAGKTYETVEKPTFGSTALPELIRTDAGEEDFRIELIGLCTDICVVSNALLLKANFPEKTIAVDGTCCAGVSPETHRAALATMRCCQIDVKEG